MIQRIVFKDCDGEDFVLEYLDDGSTHPLDLDQLDKQLELECGLSEQTSEVDTDSGWDDPELGRYIDSLCNSCGAEPEAAHTCYP